MSLYEFKESDAWDFARQQGIQTKQKGEELHFIHCPYCGSTKDKWTFAIDLRTGQFKCLRASCSRTGNMITLSKDFDFSLGRDIDEYYNRSRKQYRTFQKPMPHQTGTFINVTSAQSAALAGSGRVVAAAPPMGRFLYEGKKMVDEKTGRGPFNVAPEGETPVWRYQKGAKLKATDQPLNYDKSHNPEVTDHWFDEAKKRHCDNWVKVVKSIAGGGEKKV